MYITRFPYRFQCSPTPKCLWKPRNGSQTLSVHLPPSNCRIRRRKCVVVAASDGNKKPSHQEEDEEEIQLDEQQMMELEFGRLLGEDPKKTLAKVIGRKLNPDASHIDIEKFMEGRSSVRLKKRLHNSLIDTEEWQLHNFSNSKSLSRNNTGKNESLDCVRRAVRREGKGVISPSDSNRPDHHTKALLKGSDSKNINHEGLLRKPASPETKAQALQQKEVVSPTDPNRLGGHAKATGSDSINITNEVLLRKPSSPETKARAWDGNEFASLTDPNWLGNNTKALSTESNSKNTIPDVLLRKPSSPRKSRGFAFQHKTPLSSSITKNDKSEKNLEDVVILRRPEAIKIDNSLSKNSSDLEAKVVIRKDSSGSETDGGNTHDAEQKSIDERVDLKREQKIPLTRPTFPTNPNALRDHEMDAKLFNGYTEDKLYHDMIVSEKKEDASSSPSKETQDMDGITPIPAKSDNMFREDINISIMVPVPSVKLESHETKNNIQDCREGKEVEVEAQNIRQTTCLESVLLNLEASVSTGSSSVHFYEANTVERKSTEHIDSSGFSSVSEIARQDSNDICNVTDTGLDLAYSVPQLAERTSRDGAGDVSNKKVHRPSLADSLLRKPLYQMESSVNNIHGEEFERNAKISDQNESSQAVKEGKDHDWANAEVLHKSGEFEEVELLSCNETGFSVLFGSLLGLLPYRDLGPRRRPLPFENWLQQKGYDLSKFQKVMTKEYQNLLNLYNQDKTRFLSSFVGQKTRAVVTFVDAKSGSLLFSENPRRTRDAEKKATMMDKLNIGDIVTCQVAKIESFGVFVELEGVSALIHQSELSWDPLWDVNSSLKVGEVVKAKVCSLDRSRQRINLSLKQLKPDPLLETLESIVKEEDEHTSSNLETGEMGKEWPEVQSLIRELELVDGIQNVSKGRFLLTPGLAPSFQVYLSDSYGDHYKILARSGNKVQEIVVKASLDRDGIKTAIGLCTSRVALVG